ncbi:hypothetical protein SAMN02910456_02431 [Ruminococcaceae bacterium YRB3002]|nr:hypothetical protein SAMN02910456_02431 [Ruminococcaceae bacterium YRB3002]
MRIVIATRFKPEDEWENSPAVEFDGTVEEYFWSRTPDWALKGRTIREFIQLCIDAGTLKIVEPENW